MFITKNPRSITINPQPIVNAINLNQIDLRIEVKNMLSLREIHVKSKVIIEIKSKLIKDVRIEGINKGI